MAISAAALISLNSPATLTTPKHPIISPRIHWIHTCNHDIHNITWVEGSIEGYSASKMVRLAKWGQKSTPPHFPSGKNVRVRKKTKKIPWNKIKLTKKQYLFSTMYMCRCALKNEVYNNSCYSYSNKWQGILQLSRILYYPVMFNLNQGYGYLRLIKAFSNCSYSKLYSISKIISSKPVPQYSINMLIKNKC